MWTLYLNYFVYSNTKTLRISDTKKIEQKTCSYKVSLQTTTTSITWLLELVVISYETRVRLTKFDQFVLTLLYHFPVGFPWNHLLIWVHLTLVVPKIGPVILSDFFVNMLKHSKWLLSVIYVLLLTRVPLIRTKIAVFDDSFYILFCSTNKIEREVRWKKNYERNYREMRKWKSQC